jgi:hypothetical protein
MNAKRDPVLYLRFSEQQLWRADRGTFTDTQDYWVPGLSKYWKTRRERRETTTLLGPLERASTPWWWTGEWVRAPTFFTVALDGLLASCYTSFFGWLPLQARCSFETSVDFQRTAVRAPNPTHRTRGVWIGGCPPVGPMRVSRTHSDTMEVFSVQCSRSASRGRDPNSRVGLWTPPYDDTKNRFSLWGTAGRMFSRMPRCSHRGLGGGRPLSADIIAMCSSAVVSCPRHVPRRNAAWTVLQCACVPEMT